MTLKQLLDRYQPLFGERFHQQAAGFFWCLMALVMPYTQMQGTRFTAIIAIGIMANAVFGTHYLTSWDRIKNGYQQVLPFWLLYGLTLLSAVYTNDYAEAGYYISLRLSLLWVPLMLLIRPLTNQQWQLVALAFAASCTLGFCWMNRSGLVWLQDCPICYVEILGIMSRPYLAPYLVGAALFLRYAFNGHHNQTLTKIGVNGWSLLLLLASLTVYAKMTMVGLGMVLILCLLGFWSKRILPGGSLWLLGWFSKVVVLLSVLVPFLLPQLKGYGNSVMASSAAPWWVTASFGTRFQIWEVVSEALMTSGHWLWGTGTGGLKLALHDLYCQLDLDLCATQYNPHNQYLEQWLQSGIFGIGLLFYLLDQQHKLALRTNNLILGIWTSFIASALFTECMLNRESGLLLITIIGMGLQIGRLTKAKAQ